MAHLDIIIFKTREHSLAVLMIVTNVSEAVFKSPQAQRDVFDLCCFTAASPMESTITHSQGKECGRLANRRTMLTIECVLQEIARRKLDIPLERQESPIQPRPHHDTMKLILNYCYVCTLVVCAS